MRRVWSQFWSSFPRKWRLEDLHTTPKAPTYHNPRHSGQQTFNYLVSRIDTELFKKYFSSHFTSGSPVVLLRHIVKSRWASRPMLRSARKNGLFHVKDFIFTQIVLFVSFLKISFYNTWQSMALLLRADGSFFLSWQQRGYISLFWHATLHSLLGGCSSCSCWIKRNYFDEIQMNSCVDCIL